jgi:dienelactone hydrolase
MRSRVAYLLPLERARPAADGSGYILISSYNTVSDSTVQPNIDAVRAILQDARTWPGIDADAIALVGFSGTARLAWYLSTLFPGVTAIMGAGGSGASFANNYAAPVPRVTTTGCATCNTSSQHATDCSGTRAPVRNASHTHGSQPCSSPTSRP